MEHRPLVGKMTSQQGNGPSFEVTTNLREHRSSSIEQHGPKCRLLYVMQVSRLRQGGEGLMVTILRIRLGCQPWICREIKKLFLHAAIAARRLKHSNKEILAPRSNSFVSGRDFGENNTRIRRLLELLRRAKRGEMGASFPRQELSIDRRMHDGC
ncbi:predicted protein [Coccidioides posadasii str. Silveira]|uniref:Predicted protein n=2 Tax=Coccidioides posadasii TaxID=199306 RepID=E9D256_COCPS|nr:predicted protein [Coccidioides posadasii str. Silveira]KMM71735.1 hypothetical protein CPAG_08036 [Coccidioides posadasii RMSCC 3488]